MEQKCSITRPLLSKYLNSLDIGLREVGAKRPLNGLNSWRRKNPEKKLFLPWQFYTIFEQKSSDLRPLLSISFSKDSEYQKKCLDIGLREMGSKRLLNGVNKVWRKDQDTKQKKSALSENSKAYPSSQKLRDDDNFFLSARIRFRIFWKSTFSFFYKAYFS